MNPQIRRILNSNEAGAAVLRAADRLLELDSLLLELDANERSIGYRLAMYLQDELPHLHVDCEYNRDGVDPKKIQHLGLYPDDQDTEAKTAFPDIIAHTRNTSENYLVIELKKSTNGTDRKVDFAKLKGYKVNLGFTHALFLEFETGQKAGLGQAEWVTN